MPMNKGYNRVGKTGNEGNAKKGATPRDPHGNMTTSGAGRKNVNSTVENAGIGSPRKK